MGLHHLDKVRVEKRAIASSWPVRVALPFPPSVNNLFANGSHGRFRTPTYNKWRDAAGAIINTSRTKCITGPVAISIKLSDIGGRRDLDNFAKACLDILVHMNVIDGDDSRTVRRLEMEWANVEGAHISIVPHDGAVRAA